MGITSVFMMWKTELSIKEVPKDGDMAVNYLFKSTTNFNYFNHSH